MSMQVLAVGALDPSHPAFAEATSECGAGFRFAADVGAASLDLLRQPCDVLLVYQPLRESMNLVRGVRLSDEGRDLPILAVLAEPSAESAGHVLAAGADDFLPLDHFFNLTCKLLAAASAIDAVPAARPPSRRVILADSSLLHRLVLGRLLGEVGYEVLLAADGLAALRLFEAQPAAIDLLLLDLSLPLLDALAVLDQVRSRLGEAAPSAIALASETLPERLRQAAREAGFAHIHPKQRPPEELVFLANQRGAAVSHDGRAHPRYLCSMWARYRLLDETSWQTGLTHTFGLGGVFVRTMDPPPLGTQLEIRFQPPLAPAEIRLRAHVAWRKEFAARRVRSYPTGMGLAFGPHSTEAQEVIDRAVAHLAAGGRQ
jgi:CheY-like chemotaxis protein